MKYCIHCGAEIMDEAVVCVHCGCSVKNDTPITEVYWYHTKQEY